MDAYVCIYSCRCARAGGRVCVSVCSHKFVCTCVSLCIFVYVNICVCIPTSTCAWIKNNINKPIKNIKISHLIHQLTKHIKKHSFFLFLFFILPFFLFFFSYHLSPKWPGFPAQTSALVVTPRGLLVRKAISIIGRLPFALRMMIIIFIPFCIFPLFFVVLYPETNLVILKLTFFSYIFYQFH